MKSNLAEDHEDDADSEPIKPKSDLSIEVARLKASIGQAIEQRERLPQPLFWSLFNSKIKDLREQKEQNRRVEDLLNKLD